MKIIIAKNLGFCSGVKRALRLAHQEIDGGQICSIGPLIHNRHAVAELEAKGIRVVDRVGAAEGKVLIRSHGVEPEIIESLEARNLEVVDLTCPNVAKVQHYGSILSEEGYKVVVVGEAEHPEVKGILGFIRGKGEVFRPDMEVGPRIGIIAQTTIDLDQLISAVNYILLRASEVKIYNTICAETLRRRFEAITIAQKVKTMLVVGGKNSANTSRLAELCSRYVRTFHIEDGDEIVSEMLEDSGPVGVVSGTSTPEWVIDQVIKTLKRKEALGR
ncbi:MAG TPA: 4-hydroxy-3-methylbut-2-enyl diphosphate reductase [bacterium (Candidatus Stahlbacteria)]|nr:4-hydroxy-3-methylbut-2-enyl diphosphate reductase [Candidatus Stahlbacteria bacterium]